jgi:hypothetical protein
VLAVFTDDSDASTGTVRAMTGWEDAKVADPADDFAALVADAPPEAVETVLEAYAHARVERPDANLMVRARLVAELGLLAALMHGLARKDVGTVEVLTTQLRRLDDAVHSEDEHDDYHRTSLTPVGIRRSSPPPALVVDEDDEDLPELAPADEADGPGDPTAAAPMATGAPADPAAPGADTPDAVVPEPLDTPAPSWPEVPDAAVAAPASDDEDEPTPDWLREPGATPPESQAPPEGQAPDGEDVTPDGQRPAPG